MSKSFKVIIAGGRDFDDYALLRDKCDKILSRFVTQPYLKHKGLVEIVSGTANGADKLGEVYAIHQDFEIARFPADWDDIDTEPCVLRQNRAGKQYNALAGNIRNKKMAEYADALIAFWDGKSRGTQDMVNIMKKMGKLVRVVNYGLTAVEKPRILYPT
ncbi:MAG: DUF2493 domain-containing protein [Desulfobulbaceae bacterium]|nr:DUF2493 domain-containing protein [Desulfobulbaceae bacterium]